MNFVSASAFAKIVGLPYRIVRDLIWRGQLPHLKSGKRVLLDIDTATDALKDVLLESQKQSSAANPQISIISRERRPKKNTGRLPDKLRIAGGGGK